MRSKIKNRHPVAPEELMAFMDGELEGERKAAVERHLNQCQECRTLLDGLKLAEREVAEAEQIVPPEGYFATFASRVAHRIAEKELASARRPWFLRWGWMPAAAAAAFAIFIVLSHDFSHQPEVHKIAKRRKLIPIPIAPEHRSFDGYYQEELVMFPTPASEATAHEEPAAEPRTLISQEEPLRGAVTKAQLEMDRQAAERLSQTPKTGPLADPMTRLQPSKTTDVQQKQERAPVEDALQPSRMISSEEGSKIGRIETVGVRKILRYRSSYHPRFYKPEDFDTCPSPEVVCLQAIVIYLPDSKQAPPPQLEPALRLCLPKY